MKMSLYVNWEEVFVDNKGKKEVLYYLRRRDGGSDLVVVGKERSSSKNNTMMMLSYEYVVVKNMSVSSCLKLRSRRDVVHWLNSIVSASDSHQAGGPIGDACDIKSAVLKNVQMQERGKHSNEFMWLGAPWVCRKNRKHHKSFSRNGVIVSAREFVYVLAEENKKLVAYLDDMYEDSRGSRMVVVRWFHKIDEVGNVLPHNYNDREIFFSLCLQTLSIECIDGLASVLSPQHYERFLNEARRCEVKPFVCRWLFDDDDLQPFDITRLKGYWDQDIMRYLSFLPPSRTQPACNSLKGEGIDANSVGSRPKKRLRLTKASDTKFTIIKKEAAGGHLKDSDNSIEGFSDLPLPKKDVPKKQAQCFTIGAQVEILSQDSGIRGCWLRAVIVKKHKNKVKVQYQDIKDAEDEAKNLEEWVLASKVAAADAFGARISGRSILRPSPVSNTGKVSWAVNVGCIVDAWWHNAWWEGIVIEKESEDKVRVHLLGENREMIFARNDLRHAQEWLEDGWRNLKEKPELVSALTALKVKPKMDDPCHIKQEQAGICNSQELLSGPSKSSPNKVEEARTVLDLSKDNSLAELRWKSSGKRRRSRSPVHQVHYTGQNNRRGDFVMGRSSKFIFPSKVDPDNCKYISDSVFTSVVSPLTNLVMSR